MKKIIVALMLALLLFSGCADRTIVLVPQSEYYPTFPTQDFEKKEKYPFVHWAEQETLDVNGTLVTKNYMVAEEKDGLNFVEDTKTLRSTYNLLLRKVIEFNAKITELNIIQNEKQPTEVEKIDDKWFK